MSDNKYFIMIIYLIIANAFYLKAPSQENQISDKKELLNQSTPLIGKVPNTQSLNDADKAELKNQSIKIDKLIERIENPPNNFLKDYILLPIIPSVIAGIIFWLIFNYFPDMRRKKKIRPMLELEMYAVFKDLFYIFDIIMKSKTYSSSSYQVKIIGNKLEKEDIELGLQNKSLTDTFLHEHKFKDNFVVIGKKLYDKICEIDILVGRLFSFNAYLSEQEILLLEQIRRKCRFYVIENYKPNGQSSINGVEFSYKNPSISNLTQHYYELYKMYVQYQEIVFSNNYSDSDIAINKVQSFFNSEQYLKCKLEIKNAILKYPEKKIFLEYYSFLCEYFSGNKADAYQILESLLKKDHDLISNRTFFKDVLQDAEIVDLIKKYFTESEIENLKEELRKEDTINKNFIEQAKTLQNYYKSSTE